MLEENNQATETEQQVATHQNIDDSATSFESDDGVVSGDVNRVDVEGAVNASKSAAKSAEKPTNINDFLNLRADSKALLPDGSTKSEAKVEVKEQSAEEKVKAEADAEAKLAREQDALIAKSPEEKAATEAAKQGKQERDFTGLPKSDHWLYQRMSTPTFNAMKARHFAFEKTKTELAEAKAEIKKAQMYDSKLPASYYEHPEGYRLSPEFAQLDMQVGLAEQIRDHWEAQLISVKRGGQWQEISLDQRTGQLHTGALRDATVEDEIAINKYFNFATKQHVGLESKHTEFTSKFKERHKADSGTIDQALVDLFPDFINPEHKIHKDTKAYQERVVSLLPQSYQKHPLAKLVGVITAALAVESFKNRSKAQTEQAAAGTAKDAQQAPPTSKQFQTAASNGSVKLPSFSDFKKAREVV